MSRLMVFTVLFLAAGLLLYPMTGTSHAANASESCQLRFLDYDIDHDGRITLQEFQASYNEGQYAGTVPTPGGKVPAFVTFAYLDRDEKGYLTPNDFCPA
jgi:hypothetical protein